MPSAEAPHTESFSRPLTLAAHAAFVPIGIMTVLLGPMLPSLSARWSLNYEQAGWLFTAQFAASTLGVALSGILVSRLGFRFAINAGLLAMAVGVAGLSVRLYWLGLVGIASYGVGLGLSVPAANLLVAEVNPTRRSAALNLLNFSWSVGAVACPFLVAAAAKSQRILVFLAGVAAWLLLVLLGIAAMPSRVAEPVVRGSDQGGPPIEWNGRPLVVLAALFFLYVGTENAFGGWIASYAKSLGSMALATAVMTPSFFYTALLVGRWLAPLILRKVDDIKLARAGILVACVGMTGLLLSHAMPGVVTSVSMAGLGLSAVYPITISLLAREFGPAAYRVGSVMFTMANLGGASVPWLVGYSSSRLGNLRTGLYVPLISGVFMYVVYFLNWRTIPARQSVA
jgi:FHS family glucose/mannose:H+ symporter-like MFS transporter